MNSHPKKKLLSVWLHPFSLQSMVSFFPAVMLVPALPFLMEGLDVSFVQIGLLFLAVRLGGVLGSTQISRWLSYWSPKRVCIFAEVTTFFCLLGLFAALKAGVYEVIFVLVLFRYILLTLVTLARFQWLKQFEKEDLSQSLNLLANTMTQLGFGLMGALLFFDFIKSNPALFLALDAMSSLIGACLFATARERSLPLHEKSSFLQSTRDFWNQLKTSPSLKNLLGLDVAMALALGGTNILLLHFGESFLNDVGGYPMALIIYSLLFLGSFFALDSNLKERLRLNQFWGRAFIFMIVLSLGLITLLEASMTFGLLLSFCLLLTAYAVYALEVQQAWFRELPPNLSGPLFGLRTMLITICWGFGEYLYAELATPYAVRTGFALIGLIFIVRWTVKLKVLSP